MLLRELFTLLESHDYTPTQEFMIKSWGKLLYLDYLKLPSGEDMSNTPEFKSLVKDYANAEGNDDELEELDEWVNEGAPLTNGKYLINRQTVDVVLSSAQRQAGKRLTLFRFNHTPSKLQPDSWISLTKNENGPYSGDKLTFNIDVDDLIIDAYDLADDEEVIVNTNVLIRKLK